MPVTHIALKKIEEKMRLSPNQRFYNIIDGNDYYSQQYLMWTILKTEGQRTYYWFVRTARVH